MAITINIDTQIITKTSAQWAVDNTVYSDIYLLYVSDLFYGATDQQQWKKADGVQTFADLDFMPIGSGSGSSADYVLLEYSNTGGNALTVGADYFVSTGVTMGNTINSSTPKPTVAGTIEEVHITTYNGSTFGSSEPLSITLVDEAGTDIALLSSSVLYDERNTYLKEVVDIDITDGRTFIRLDVPTMTTYPANAKLDVVLKIKLADSVPVVVASPTVANTPLQDLESMFLDAYYSNREINYIVSGDSTRNGSTVTEMQDYYRVMFNQLNIPIVYSAEASLDANEWENNLGASSSAKLSYAVAQSLGTDGIDTILEFSFGINDYSGLGGVKADIKTQLQSALDAYLLAMPSATIVLVSPTGSGETRTDLLEEIYIELADENNMVLVLGSYATRSTYPTQPNAFHTESTHINNNGAKRLVNYLLNEIIPPSIAWTMTYIDYDTVEAETALIEEAVIQTGMWHSSGSFLSGANWRSLEEVTVVPRTLIKIKHQGTRRDFLWKDSVGAYTTVNFPVAVPGVDYYLFVVPDDVVSIKVNVESVSGTAYDLLGDVPELHNVVPLISYNMPTAKLNEGLNLRIK